MQNKVFQDIFGTKELEWDGETWDTTLITHHKLLKGEIPYKEVTGGKTGYINASGFTLATTAETNKLSLIVITLNSSTDDEAYHDSEKLLDHAFNNYETTTIQKGTIFKLENEQYSTVKNIFYTSSINWKVNESVNSDGTLDIIEENGNLIANYQLEKKNVATPNIVEKGEKEFSFNLVSTFLVLILSLIALNLYFRFSKSSNPNYRE